MRYSLALLPPIIMLGSLSLTGCYTALMHMRYGSLDAQTEMSEAVFLELRTDLPQTVYIAEACSAGRDLTVRPALDRALKASGYTLVNTPEEATYIVQINHLRITETELKGESTLEDAISSALAAGSTAALATAEVLDAPGAAGEVGLAVGVVGFIVDSQTKHIAHLLTTEVLVTESVRADEGELELRSHETQIVSGASKVGLKIEESLPVMMQGTSNSLAHLLPTTAG